MKSLYFIAVMSAFVLSTKTNGTPIPTTVTPQRQTQAAVEPNDSLGYYEGFLLNAGNRVFIPQDSTIDYIYAGQKIVFKNVLEKGFWTIVDRPDYADFVLHYVSSTSGRKQAALLIETPDFYLKEKEDLNFSRFYADAYKVSSRYSDENVFNNEKLAHEFSQRLNAIVSSIANGRVNPDLKKRFTRAKTNIVIQSNQSSDWSYKQPSYRPISSSSQYYYTNPILKGDYPDPTIIREGNDYYMTHSSFDYQPGLIVYHSNDLINWEPISYALHTNLGSVWAPDICHFGNRYYIYFTVALKQPAGAKTNYVVYANSPYGPWSEPIDLRTGDIDPCHVVGENGQRWLFLSGGKRVRLSADGLSVLHQTKETIYKGWQYPEDWITEGLSLEGPKIRKIGDYYYYLNAEGGTAGPATSHMVIVARSKSINGPWENSPFNPLIHTYQASDRWWSRGHGSLIDTPDGRWFCIYHAYQNNFTDLGRQTLIEPVVLGRDHWFHPVITDAEGLSADPIGKIEAPLPLCPSPLSKEKLLTEFRIGKEWKFYKSYEPERISVSNGALTIQAKGKTPGDSSPFLFVAGEESYEIECEIQLNTPTANAGIVLYYDSVFFMGNGTSASKRLRYRKGIEKGGSAHPEGCNGRHIWLRLRNDRHIITGWYSYDGEYWMRETWSMDISGYNHNTLYQFQSVLPGLFCTGDGSATFKNFKYRVLNHDD